MRPSPRSLAPAFVVAAALGCSHPQEDGRYALTAELPPIRDDCGLLDSPALGTLDLVIQGDVVRMTVWLEDLELRSVGAYLSGVEGFYVDGNVANVTSGVTGEECLLDLAQVHLDARTESPDRFHGTLRLTLQTQGREACTCSLWAAFTATRE